MKMPVTANDSSSQSRQQYIKRQEVKHVHEMKRSTKVEIEMDQGCGSRP